MKGQSTWTSNLSGSERKHSWSESISKQENSKQSMSACARLWAEMPTDMLRQDHNIKSSLLEGSIPTWAEMSTDMLLSSTITCFTSFMQRISLCLLSEFALLASVSSWSWSSVLHALPLSFPERIPCLALGSKLLSAMPWLPGVARLQGFRGSTGRRGMRFRDRLRNGKRKSDRSWSRCHVCNDPKAIWADGKWGRDKGLCVAMKRGVSALQVQCL